MTVPVSVGLVVSPVVGCTVDSVGSEAVAVSSQSLSVVCDEEVVSDGVGIPDTLGVGVTVVDVEIVLLLEVEVVGITGLLVEVLDV